jgi:AcrR family transcriptional regulator
MGHIARQAGVGVATLHRRFPKRSELIEACMATRMEEHLTAANAALSHPDPWEGFAHYLRVACGMQAGDLGVNDMLVRSFPPNSRMERHRRAAYEAVEQVMVRAQRQGQLRPDVTVDDVPLLLMANAGVVRATYGTRGDPWRRVLELTLDGLRVGEHTPLSPAPPRYQVLRALVRASRGSASFREDTRDNHPARTK